MKRPTVRQAVTAIGSVIVVFVVDRILKLFVVASPAKTVIDAGPFAIRFETNERLAFGIPVPNGIVVAIVIVLMIVFGWMVVWAARQSVLNTLVGASAVLVGALSNLIDRLAYGSVVDYIAIGGLPVFNLADTMIVAGVVILFFRRRVDGTD